MTYCVKCLNLELLNTVKTSCTLWKPVDGIWTRTVDKKAGMKDSKATFVFGQMNEPPGARARVALSGLTIAEYFRDGAGERTR